MQDDRTEDLTLACAGDRHAEVPFMMPMVTLTFSVTPSGHQIAANTTDTTPADMLTYTTASKYGGASPTPVFLSTGIVGRMWGGVLHLTAEACQPVSARQARRSALGIVHVRHFQVLKEQRGIKDVLSWARADPRSRWYHPFPSPNLSHRQP